MTTQALKLTGHIHVEVEHDELFDALASSLMSAAIDAVDQRGECHMALSGGSTPEPFYMRLVIDPRYRAIPWQHTHLWIVDERRVPETHDKSNFRMIREALADHVPLKKRNTHPMPVMNDDPAGEYEKLLRSHVDAAQGDGPLKLDFVLLGMGDDAHTASLFPQSRAISEMSRWITVNEGEHVTPPDRVTMTYPLLNAARHTAVLVTGAKKAPTLRLVDEQVRTKGPDPKYFPITGVQPDNGDLVWYLDAAAAGQA